VGTAAESAGGFVASLHGLSLIDTLQMFHYSRRSLTMRVVGEVPAALHMREGQLVHAEYGEQRGEAALGQLLRLPAGSLRTSAPEPVTPTIDRDFSAVLLDQLTKMDEAERDSQLPQLPGRVLDALPDVASAARSRSTSSESPPRQPSPSDPPAPDAGSPRNRASAVSGERPVVRPPELARPRGKTLEKIDIACDRVVRLVPGGVACALVELQSGILLGLASSGDLDDTQKQLLAGATVDLFRGPNVARMEGVVQQRGDAEPAEHSFEELQLTSKENLYFAKTLKGGRGVILLVTKRSTSLGMGWAQLKAAIPVLERLMP
jgi:Domain of unknown function (DUF4388)